MSAPADPLNAFSAVAEKIWPTSSKLIP